MPERRRATASVALYSVGHGDPIIGDHGFGWYDILKETHEDGRSTLNNSGIPFLEYVDDIGLCCRPFTVPQDTPLADWNTSGMWEERQPDASRCRFLGQYDSRPDQTWSATLRSPIPRDPHVAFSFVFADTPIDQDLTAKPPFVRFELGGSQWAVLVTRGAGTKLLYNRNGVWEVATNLPEPAPHSLVDGDERQIWVRPMRGRIAISCDWGESYKVYNSPETPDNTHIRSGVVKVTGQGTTLTFGLHQLRYFAGTYTSVTRDTGTGRVAALALFNSRKEEPEGSSITFADASVPLQRIAQYRSTLTPGSRDSSSWPFRFYWSPSLYAVTFRYAPIAIAGGSDTTTPWDTYIRAVDIEKPPRLQDSSCGILFDHDAWTLFDEDLRGRKVIVKLGWIMDDDTTEWVVAFTGYLLDPVLSWSEEFGRTMVELQVDNMSARLRDMAEWTMFDVVPLGGMTPNAAADYILSTEGLNASYRSWHAWGSAFTLDAGYPEDPCELVRPGETKWETLQRIFSYARLELGVSDDGVYTTVPRGYVEDTVTFNFRATPTDAADIREQLASVSHRIDYSEMATAVVVTGRHAVTRKEMYAFAVDTGAETNAASGRFNPWRKVVQDDLPGTTTPALLLGRCQELATELFRVPYAPDFEVPVNHELHRAQRVGVYGCEGVGIPDGMEHGILTLHHSYRFDDESTLTSLRTTAGLWRP